MAVIWALLVLIVLPAGIFSAVFGAMALIALPLAVALALLLPRRWMRGLPALTLFFGSMLLAPVLMMAGLALSALAEKPITWEPLEWRPIDHARLPGAAWHHLFPVRSSSREDMTP
ncbi:hypothetical protein [Roseococcus sp.]|uniref:hypothetical protein n=1 Tax=Roseococcus sp. TaxID=2109646 RepID=UPI003BAC36E5